jgi:outer membrane protein assembly factor BamB
MITKSSKAILALIAVPATALLSACSGGGGSGGAGTVPVTAATQPAAKAPATVKLLIPPAPQGSNARSVRPAYVSPYTNGVATWAYAVGTAQPTAPTTTANVSSGSSICTSNSDGSRTCSIPIMAPPGNDEITLSAYDKAPLNGTPQGNLLSTGTANDVTIVANTTNVIPLTLDGVPATLALGPQLNAVATGQSQQLTLYVNALDADGNIIVDPGSFTTPINLTLADAGDTVTLGTTQIASPSTTSIAVTYSGQDDTYATITASATGAQSASIQFAPLNISPLNLSAAPSQAQTVSISDYNFSGAVSATGSTCASVSPASATPTSTGAAIAFTVTAAGSEGACTIQFSANSGNITYALPVSVTSTVGSVSVPGQPVDDWSTFAHDQLRTGLETNTTGITKATVSSLSLAWTQSIDAACGKNATVAVAYASPLVVNGVVYVVSMCGNAYAINGLNGNIIWGPVSVVSQLGQGCNYAATGTGAGCDRGTPVLVGNTLIVPVWGFQTGTCAYDSNTNQVVCTPSGGQEQGGQLVALNASTGAVVWATTPLANGVFRGEPLVLNGTVYEGVAGGDTQAGCIQGGMIAFNESTGAQESPIFHTTTVANDGGGSWSAMSTDGSSIYAGTGNTCSGPTSPQETALGVNDYEDSVVVLNPATLAVEWSAPARANFLYDNDVGGGEMIWENNLYFYGKNAVLYDYNTESEQLQWSASLASVDGDGGYGVPTTDGNAIVVTGGYTTLSPRTSTLEAFSPASGTQLWYKQSEVDGIYGYAAMLPGIAFASIDGTIYAMDSSSGATLWTSSVSASSFAAPVVVPSGVYYIDYNGNVYGYKLPQAYAGDGSTRRIAWTAHIRPLQHFAHRGTIWRDND